MSWKAQNFQDTLEEGEVINRDDLEEAVDFLFKSEYDSDEGVDPEEKETNLSQLEDSIQFLEKENELYYINIWKWKWKWKWEWEWKWKWGWKLKQK